MRWRLRRNRSLSRLASKMEGLMINRVPFALLFVAGSILTPSLQAEVVVTSDGGVATPGLPGFKTFILTATSTVPGEYIHVVDFIGNPDNDDPATTRGFFGAMNQQQVSGMATVFDAIFFPTAVDPPPEPSLLDSHFLIRSFADSGIDIVVPAGYFQENATSLRAIYAGSFALGQSIQIAQLVIPEAAVGMIHYRGSFAIARGGTLVDTPDVVGVIGTVPEPAAAVMVGLMIATICGSAYRKRPQL